MSEETPQEPVTPETPASPEPPAPAAPETPAAAAPETPAAEAPTAPEVPVAPVTPTAPAAPPVADAPPTAAAAAATPPVAAAPVVTPTATATKSAERKTVAVPMSVLITLGAIIVAALMFGIGYAVGHDGNDNSSAVSTPIGNQTLPRFPNGNGNQTLPQVPNGGNGNGNSGNGNSENGGNQQTSSPPFMGVATQQTQNGLQITEVVDNSAAAKAGLQAGDVITEFDGNAVTTPAQLGNAVAQHQVGDQVKVTFTRDGQSKTVTVTLGSRTTNN